MLRQWRMLNQFSRTQLLLGKESIERLQKDLTTMRIVKNKRNE